MVKHRWRDGTTSWILPGGGLLPGEKPEEAALRELYEETRLTGKIVRFLFTMPYNLGTSMTFLVEVDPDAQASLGYDPEESAGKSQNVKRMWDGFQLMTCAKIQKCNEFLPV